jgi:filamentous hemagglutinin family protein
MKAKKILFKTFFALSRLVPGAALLLTRATHANPTGLTVQSGTASATTSGSTLNVIAGNNAILNWQSFNIATGEKTIFNQPGAASVVWNHINDQNPSQIYGSLQANGIVVLLNSYGFYFGPNSFVSAAGLVVSTASCTPPQNAGGAWEFNGPPPLASIVNYGQIKIGNGGDCFFIADKIENHGTVEADAGSVQFAAGQTVTLSERPDGRGMSMAVKLPQGSVDNYGNVIADGGTIALNAKVVNQDGLLQADSVQNKNGVIELVASDSLNLGTDSKIFSRGDNSSSGSAGGDVTLQSQNNFNDSVGSRIVTTGGANGGNGGNVEISAPNINSLNTAMDASAQIGFTGGSFLLDPKNIILSTSGSVNIPNNGTVAYNSGSGTLNLNVNSAFANKNFSNIKLQATQDITLAGGTVWDLSGSTGNNSSGQVTLQAGRNIELGDGAQITDANDWSLAMLAGYSFSKNSVTPGTGSITLDGSSSIQLASGAINLTAGQNITVNSGYIVTTGGGGITAHALAGSIDCGSYVQGYVFQAAGSASQGYYIDPTFGVGGISTEAGGNLNLTAGGNITTVMPANSGYVYDGNFISTSSTDGTAGSGAYGSQAGDVNIVAGGDVIGHYLVANGTGNVFAGVKMDANGNPMKDGSGNYVLGSTGSAGNDSLNPNFALSIINGNWNVTAAQNIILQEVRNPNGVFNNNKSGAYHAFDYGLDDSVNLTAGNQVQLGDNSANLPRLDSVPLLFPSILNVTAGAGGVVLNGDSIINQLILYPSALGSLTINTTGGGSLVGNLPADASGAPQLFSLIVSDGDPSQYVSQFNRYPSLASIFGLAGHATTPVHLNSEQPVALNISGDMNLVFLGASEAAQINVVGNMNSSRFQGMNLSSSDVTSITVGAAAKQNMENAGILNPATDAGLTVGGDINNRSAFTSINLNNVPGATAPNLSLLEHAVLDAGSIPLSLLITSFYYDAATKTFTYQNISQSGVTLASVLALLQNLKVQVYVNGVPQWSDPPFNTVPLTTTVSVIDSATAQAMLAEYNTLGPIPYGDVNTGYTIGGGGKFVITAANVDLGTSKGINSLGGGLYTVNKGSTYPLHNLFSTGADIDLNLTGNLDMFSTSIASWDSGRITIHAGGEINVGSSQFTPNASAARGIFSTHLGDVTVIANGDINVNGSRIAAYDGGNVTVESLNGNIDAGSGAADVTLISYFATDPSTGQYIYHNNEIPGSGILATTFYNDTSTTVGNVLVEAPNGNISASAGGIVQLALNGLNRASSIVEILAGYELRDSTGNPVYAANIADGSPVQTSNARNIEANNSGVIGSTVDLNATGDIVGLIFARNNINLNAQQNVDVTALAQGTVNVNSGGTISGTIIGVGGVSASGSSIDASLLSQNVSASGDTSSAKEGFAQGTAANAASTGASNEGSDKPATKSSEGSDDELTKKKKGVALAQKVSRVTVILPKRD